MGVEPGSAFALCGGVKLSVWMPAATLPCARAFSDMN